MCLTPSCGCPLYSGCPLSPSPPLSLSSHSFLLSHSDVIQRPPQEQLHSEPAFPPSLSLSLNLFLSFLCTSRGMQGEARQGRGGCSDTIGVFFWPEKRGLSPHISFCRPSTVLYCRRVGGWVVGVAQCLGVLKGQHKDTTRHKYWRQTQINGLKQLHGQVCN